MSGFTIRRVCSGDEEFWIVEVAIDKLEGIIDNYCLLLPFVQWEKYNKEFAVVYKDKDIGDIIFGKSLPSLCKDCFKHDSLP